MQGVQQFILVLQVRRRLLNVSELLCRLDRSASAVVDAVGDDQGVAGVLGEQRIGFGVQRGRGHIPDDLVNADDFVLVLGRVQRVAEADQEDRLAVHRVHVDGAVERHG